MVSNLHVTFTKRQSKNSSVANRQRNCLRWWHPTPQLSYLEVPYRKLGWAPKSQLPDGYQRPNCSFGQSMQPKTSCSEKHAALFRELEELNMLYFPKDGTELGVLRESRYITSDADLDIFVDYPQDELLELLKDKLHPAP